MKTEKLIRRLRKFLDKGKGSDGNDHDSVDDILKRLEASRNHLQRRLQEEKRICKRKRLEAQLKIVELKLKKGRKRLHLLDAK